MVIKGIEGAGSGLAQLNPGGKEKGSLAPVEDFSRFLGDMVAKVNNGQQDADRAIKGMMSGESKGLHEVMIAVEKSTISFQLLAQVRNKVVDAYNEIMRMPV